MNSMAYPMGHRCTSCLQHLSIMVCVMIMACVGAAAADAANTGEVRIDGVPVYKQTYAGATKDYLGTSGCNMWKQGCAVTCAAMVFGYFGGIMTPDVLCDWGNNNGMFFRNGDINWPRAADSLAGVKFLERKDWSDGNAKREYLRACVDKGYRPIIQVEFHNRTNPGVFYHWVVITKYSGDEFFIIDSQDGTSMWLTQDDSKSRYRNGPNGNVPIYGCRIYDGPKPQPAASGDGHIDEPSSNSTAALDLVLVIDRTTSMRDDIDKVKAQARSIVAKLWDKIGSVRISVVTYGDRDDGEYHVDRTPFTSDRNVALNAIRSIGLHGGGDTPEDVLDGILTGLEGKFPNQWRTKANHVLILIGDAPQKRDEPRLLCNTAVKAQKNKVYGYCIACDKCPERTRQCFQRIAVALRGTSLNGDRIDDIVDTIMRTARISELQQKSNIHGAAF